MDSLTTGTADETELIEDAVPTGDSFTLDLRPHFTPFNLPTLEQVIEKVKLFVPDDDGVTVMPLRGRRLGIYKIYTTDLHPIDKNCGLSFIVQAMVHDEAGGGGDAG